MTSIRLGKDIVILEFFIQINQMLWIREVLSAASTIRFRRRALICFCRSSRKIGEQQHLGQENLPYTSSVEQPRSMGEAFPTTSSIKPAYLESNLENMSKSSVKHVHSHQEHFPHFSVEETNPGQENTSQSSVRQKSDNTHNTSSGKNLRSTEDDSIRETFLDRWIRGKKLDTRNERNVRGDMDQREVLSNNIGQSVSWVEREDTNSGRSTGSKWEKERTVSWNEHGVRYDVTSHRWNFKIEFS